MAALAPMETEPTRQEDAERRQLTVMFTDLVGSTALSTKLDPQLADRFNERQPASHRALGIILMRARIAEIHQHPIAHVLGHETVEPGERLRDAPMIRAGHRTHVLGVDLNRERGRAYKAAEDDTQLAAFGVVLPSWLGPRGRDGCCCGCRGIVV